MSPKDLGILGALLSSLAIPSAACAPKDDQSAAPSPRRTLRVEQPFPSRQELDELTKSGAPKPDLEAMGIPADADTWTIDGPTPTRVGADPPSEDDANARAVASVLSKDPDGRAVTAQAQCVAREHARFALAHGSVASSDIGTFIAVRCGVPVVGQVRVVQDERDAKGMPPTLDAERDAELIRSALAAMPPDSEVGMWLAIEENRYAFAVIVFDRKSEIELEPIEMQGAHAGHVDLRGTLTWDAEWLEAQATRGQLGYANCRPIPDTAAVAPEFALRCPVDPSDTQAILQITAARRGALLGRRVAQIFVSPDGSMPATYQATVGGVPVDAHDHSPASYLAAINTLRARIDQKPLTLSRPQSDIVGNLLPHWVTASTRRDSKLSDQIALGIMAGYEIQGPIANASIRFSFGHENWSVERTLAAELFSPFARAVLLSSQADVIAIATASTESARGRSGAMSTYTLFEPRDFSAEEQAVLDALDARRNMDALPPVLRVQGPKDRQMLDAAAERIRTGASDPAQELDTLLQHFAEQTRRPFRGLIMSPMRIDGWAPTFDEHLLEIEHLAVAIKITYFQPPGVAWGQHVVLIVFTELPGPVQP